MTELAVAAAAQVATLTGLVAGTNLFVSRAPETPDATVTITEYEGQAASYVMGGGDVLDRPRLRMLVRGTKAGYPAARALADVIHRGLDQTEQVWDGWRVHRSVPVSTPTFVGFDDTDRPMLSVRFELTVTRP